ncbi:MAG: hypothetical protein KJO79_05440 [Verrucomicrobiae bacterium]|nr:hypothetical protein [Verrucomicrobiae bacterium]NNJ86604.1 hypothetical protein [Akkermansiaceae bacterium]
MKSTLSRMTVAASMILSLFVMSCGKKDTAESLSDEVVAQMNELVAAISSAKDKESAEQAASKIDAIGDELVDIAARLDALGDPSEDDKKMIKEKMETAKEENNKKLTEAMTAAMGNTDAREVLMKAMDSFSKKMKEVDATYKKFGLE